MIRHSLGLLIGSLLVCTVLAVGATGASARDAMVTFRVLAPEFTPQAARVYVTGDLDLLGPWDPGKIELGRIGDLQYAITLVLPVGSALKYKFTRGSWETVEKGPDFEEIPDRELVVTGDETIPIEIANWRDFTIESGMHTVVGDFRLHLDFPSAKLSNTRTIIVYLPPGYDDEDDGTRHPVLYMHDGQNLFDGESSFSGVEWSVDEAVARMVEARQARPVVVVGIYNTDDRFFEYAPVADPDRGGGGANLYADFIVDELKPFIDANYRTLPDRANTGVMGSSLGGLVSLYIGWRYPGVFSKIGAMSPSYWWANNHIVRFIENYDAPRGLKVWIDMGTGENPEDRDRDGVPDNLALHRRVRDALMAKGFVLGRDLRYLEDEGAVHNERAWASRFPQALEFLFPARRRS
jgi:predicted alpha/beta superfamily hydrolase